MNPLVSVVIPVYNSENTIKFSLISVIKQSYTNFEIIIIDDGSKDTSKKMIEEIISANKKIDIKYFYQENQGVSAARNLGIKKAKGDFIAFLDSDDAWDIEKLKIQINQISNNPDIDLLGTNRDGAKFTKFLWVTFNKITFIPPKLLLYKNFFMTSSLIFKKEIIDSVGYFKEGFNYSEDLEFCLRIAKKFDCYLYNESLVHAVMGKPSFGHSGLCSSLWKMEKGELLNIKMAYNLKIIGLFEYYFLNIFSFLKFLRRILITMLRSNKN